MPLRKAAEGGKGDEQIPRFPRLRSGQAARDDTSILSMNRESEGERGAVLLRDAVEGATGEEQGPRRCAPRDDTVLGEGCYRGRWSTGRGGL